MKYFIVGVLIACFAVTEAFSKEERELKMRIASVLKERKATVGIAVLYGDNRLFEVNRGDYPMMSVCKFPLASCSFLIIFIKIIFLSIPRYLFGNRIYYLIHIVL